MTGSRKHRTAACRDPPEGWPASLACAGSAKPATHYIRKAGCFCGLRRMAKPPPAHHKQGVWPITGTFTGVTEPGGANHLRACWHYARLRFMVYRQLGRSSCVLTGGSVSGLQRLAIGQPKTVLRLPQITLQPADNVGITAARRAGVHSACTLQHSCEQRLDVSRHRPQASRQ